ncbi:MAG: apolipoprotein N-acyltransferase [Ornithinimicrobium sp.]
MLLRLLLAALGGLGLWLSFPAFNLWFLAPVGLALIVLSLTGVGVLKGAVLGLVAGWASFIPLLSWSGIFVGALPWLALATLSALYIAAFGAVVAYLQGRDPDTRVRPVAVALTWMVAEFARATTPFGGFPWGRVGFSQADSPVLAVVRWVGVPGLGFIVALSGAFLALGIHTWRLAPGAERRGVPRRFLASLTAMGLAVAVLVAPVLIQRPTDGPALDVVAVQGNVPEMTLEFNAQRRAVLDNHVEATKEAAELVRAGEIARPDLVLWPENSSDIDPLRNADAAVVIDDAVRAIDAPLVVGAVVAPPEQDLANVSLLYLPGEGPVQSYVKRRPVPFAEYIPYRDFFRNFSDKVDLVSTNFGAGDEVGLLEVPLGDDDPSGDETAQLGVAICFEVVIDDVMADTVVAGADVLAVPTNNATFGFTDESVQQLAASRVKAVELGRSIVHISTVGVSGFVAPDGSVTQQSELFTRAILSGEVTRRTEITPAVRLSTWLERGAAVALSLLVVVTLIGRRSRRHDEPSYESSSFFDDDTRPEPV